MIDDLVTVARFTTAMEAELLRGALKACGIESRIDGAEIATVGAFACGGWGTVRVQVEAQDARAAAFIIAEHDDAARCGVREGCLLCGAPLAASATSCTACGWTWKVSDPTD